MDTAKLINQNIEAKQKFFRLMANHPEDAGLLYGILKRLLSSAIKIDTSHSNERK